MLFLSSPLVSVVSASGLSLPEVSSWLEVSAWLLDSFNNESNPEPNLQQPVHDKIMINIDMNIAIYTFFTIDKKILSSF